MPICRRERRPRTVPTISRTSPVSESGIPIEIASYIVNWVQGRHRTKPYAERLLALRGASILPADKSVKNWYTGSTLTGPC